MALTYGFFNSLNGDRTYNAIQFTSIFDGLITDGVFATYGQGLVVSASNPASLVVNVGTGRAWFNHTWTYNDAILSITCSAANAMLPRIDAIVLEINSDQSTRANSIKFVQGTAATNPAAPTMVNTEYVHQYPLCYIHRAANSTTIGATNIENMIGKTACPIVTAIVETINPNVLLTRWEQLLATEIASIQAGTECMLRTQYDSNSDGIVDNADHSTDSEYYSATFTVSGWTRGSNNIWYQEANCPGLPSNMALDAPKTEISTSHVATTAALQEGLQAMCSSDGYIVRSSPDTNGKLQWWTSEKPTIDMPIYVRKATFHQETGT